MNEKDNMQMRNMMKEMIRLKIKLILLLWVENMGVIIEQQKLNI